ncbi:hypothetical protein, partial [Halomonas cupida]|uniref:hypothetical protein n=1 Tax=Halomonas cupida TaxID=44933 RepID=UPI001C3FA64C
FLGAHQLCRPTIFRLKLQADGLTGLYQIQRITDALAARVSKLVAPHHTDTFSIASSRSMLVSHCIQEASTTGAHGQAVPNLLHTDSKRITP